MSDGTNIYRFSCYDMKKNNMHIGLYFSNSCCLLREVCIL